MLSPAAAARAAGVSIRTVHHYFPGADAQLAAVAAEVETRLFPQPPPLPQTPAELPDLVTAVYHGSEGQLPLLRALVTSSIGPQIRRHRRAAGWRPSGPARADRRGAGRNPPRRRDLSLLASANAGVVLADQYGLTLPKQAAHPPKPPAPSSTASAPRPPGPTHTRPPPTQSPAQKTRQPTPRAIAGNASASTRPT